MRSCLRRWCPPAGRMRRRRALPWSFLIAAPILIRVCFLRPSPPTRKVGYPCFLHRRGARSRRRHGGGRCQCNGGTNRKNGRPGVRRDRTRQLDTADSGPGGGAKLSFLRDRRAWHRDRLWPFLGRHTAFPAPPCAWRRSRPRVWSKPGPRAAPASRRAAGGTRSRSKFCRATSRQSRIAASSTTCLTCEGP